MKARSSTDRMAVTAMLLTGVFAAIHIGKLPPALPLIRAELDLGLVAAGFVLSVFTVLGMTVAVVLGGMADRLGRKLMVIGAIAALALGGAMATLAECLPLLLVSRIVEGFGFIAIGVALPAAIFAAASERAQPMVLGIWSVYTPLGMALVIFAAPVALDHLGWRGTWWVIVALCPFVLMAALSAMNRVTLPPKVRVHPVQLAKEALSARAFGMSALIFLGYVFQ